MNRGKGLTVQNRFTQAATAPRADRSLQLPATIGGIRNLQRAEAESFNDNAVYLTNPYSDAPFDKGKPQSYEQKVYGLGLAPNIPQHLWQLIKGDAGAGGSVYRVAELFQKLAASLELTAATPYSKAIQLATISSSDQRPRHFHASLFSVGRVIHDLTPGGISPLPTDQISRFASGIPAGTPSTSGNTQFGVPQFSTTQFRIMVADESGQRFVDVDVLGTRSVNLYGFGVTVFALIKEDGYEIDRQRDDNPPLGPGILDQSIVGSRIIPILSNEMKAINNRTVTIITPGGIPAASDPTVIPIPPGTRRVQGYTNGVADSISVFFATTDPLNPGTGIGVSQGVINFIPTLGTRTEIYDVPNANSIVILNVINTPSMRWTFVFEVTS